MCSGLKVMNRRSPPEVACIKDWVPVQHAPATRNCLIIGYVRRKELAPMPLIESGLDVNKTGKMIDKQV